jgi:hypothetical protein
MACITCPVRTPGGLKFLKYNTVISTVAIIKNIVVTISRFIAGACSKYRILPHGVKVILSIG